MGTYRRELPRDRSWPLRVSEVEDVLTDLGAPRPSRIGRFAGARRGKTYFNLSWNPVRSNWAEPWGGGDEYVTVTFTSVASDRRADAHGAFITDLLPELAGWLRRALTAPEGWRILRHHRGWTWEDGRLEVSGDEAP